MNNAKKSWFRPLLQSSNAFDLSMKVCVSIYIFTYFPIGINGWSEVWLHYASNGQDTFYMEAIDGPLDGHCTNNNV